MAGLSEAEKAAGRRFRDSASATLAALNAADPPDHVIPHFLGLMRHLCAAKGGRSKALELKERYELSPIYPLEGVPAGRFGFLYREGRCLNCGQMARSDVGRLVDGWQRPPLTGRVARS